MGYENQATLNTDQNKFKQKKLAPYSVWATF